MSAVAEMEAPAHSGLNLKVKGTGGGFYFGSLRHGEVLPKWEAELCGSAAESLVADGTLEWTTEPVIRDVRTPLPKDEHDPVPAITEELDRLRRQAVELKAANKAFTAENEELRRKDGLQTRAMGEQTTEITRLKGIAASFQAKNDELTKALETATAPAKAAEAAKAKGGK